jgi:alkaline phosphatase D
MRDEDRVLPGRRDFLVGSLGAVALSGAACSDDAKSEPSSNPSAEVAWADTVLDAARFAHGVASGDPLADRVMLWTRVTVAGATTSRVRWVVATDAALSKVVSEGEADTDDARDFTVKVDATELSAGTTYYYAFAIGESRSVIGQTRTLPEGALDHLRLAFTSCANFNNGYFHAYSSLAARDDVDVWLHLGDYIYEYADGVYGDTSLGRTLSPVHETVSLEDYRLRYAQYRSDEGLQALHQKLPCIVVWDDHEFANNAYRDGAENHDPATEGPWEDRKRAAAQAFLEWLPIRVSMPKDGVPAIYRSFAFGDLVDLIMLDTRLIARDKQAGYDDAATGKGDPSVWRDPTRQILGTAQEGWFLDALSQSQQRGTSYRFIGNQVVFSPTHDPLDPTAPLFVDFWDGYQPARDRVADYILTEGIHDVVFLTGDIHTSWAIEVAKDPFDPAKYDPVTGRGAYAVELVGPAVTSLGLEDDPTQSALAPVLIPKANPHVKFAEVTRKGYVLVDVTPDAVSAEWYFVANHKLDTLAAAQVSRAKAYSMQRGSAHLTEVV